MTETPDADAGPGGDVFSMADAEWRRLRAMADRVARMEAAVAEMIDPDPDTLARLDRARIRAARAAERAQLADRLAAHLDEIRSVRRRRSEGS